MDKNLINALARLERAGAENSKATAKLHEAIKVIAAQIKDSVPSNTDLPRGYQVYSSNTAYYLGKQGDFIEPYGERDWIKIDWSQSRKASLQFAKDVADGLLDEIAAWLEERAAKATEMTTVLEQHTD